MAKQDLRNKIKELREEHSWSQAQLSEIAGVSLRTVQRIENKGICSKETMLAIASAFDIDVRDLTRLIKQNGDNYEEIHLNIFSNKLSKSKIAFISLFFALPAFYFFTANILKYNFGISFLAAPFDYFYSSPEILHQFNFYSPIIFIGGITISITLNLISIFKLRLFKNQDSVLGNFILQKQFLNIFIIGLNSIIFFSMVGYILIENL